MSEQPIVYVTSETCRVMRTAQPGEDVDGRPVEEHGDYTPWSYDEVETNALVFSASGYRFRAARAVQREMGWMVNWSPIYETVQEHVARLIRRDNEDANKDGVMAWANENMDEDDVCRRNNFDAGKIAEDIMRSWSEERTA